ncbi:MAG TPA: LLM class flavin-dependent oxidoreductase [Thermoanaerobaculia bacterium]|nr:LLM class flavin-dependent oxidoreductase [Thermoanaerobaculia bacterium]
MEIGIFQLLPAPETVGDREVIEQALWEVDCAEAGGFGSVWIAEHHLSSFGLVGSPSVYAAAVAQRTRRLRIGYAVAVLPLHHPLRLAEEISWVGHLSQGRLLVGIGPGFSPYELGAFGVPLEERHARLEEGTAILRAALAGDAFSFTGRFWSIPKVTLRPRPFQGCAPTLLRACSSLESLRRAALEGVPVMLGLKPAAQIAEHIAAYRACRAALGRTDAEIDREVAEIRVLRRVAVAPSDEEALADARQALRWELATARRVHGAGGDAAAPDTGGGPAKLADGSAVDGAAELAGACIGTPAAVLRELAALRALGVRHVIAWLSFGDLPFSKVRRAMELLSQEVIPGLAAERGDGRKVSRESRGGAAPPEPPEPPELPASQALPALPASIARG